MKLSSRQTKIIDFIKQHQEKKGYSPTVREIAAAVGLASSSTVHGHLERLEQRGYIRRGDPKSPRAIEIIDMKESKNKDVFFAGNNHTLYFLVEDNAMIKSKIKKGDTVMVRPGNVEDGEIALVSLYGRRMVRRLYKDGRQMLLESEAKTERSIFTTEAIIIGKVIGVSTLFEEYFSEKIYEKQGV